MSGVASAGASSVAVTSLIVEGQSERSRFPPVCSVCAAQTEEYADALRSLGVLGTRVAVTGSVKYDGLTGDRDNPKTAALGRLFVIPSGYIIERVGWPRFFGLTMVMAVPGILLVMFGPIERAAMPVGDPAPNA